MRTFAEAEQEFVDTLAYERFADREMASRHARAIRFMIRCRKKLRGGSNSVPFVLKTLRAARDLAESFAKGGAR